MTISASFDVGEQQIEQEYAGGVERQLARLWGSLDESAVTLTGSDVIALTAVVSGSLLSGVGIYLTYRSRTSIYRERLHSDQLDHILALLSALQRCGMYFAQCYVAMKHGDKAELDRLFLTPPRAYRTFGRLTLLSGILLPDELAKLASKMQEAFDEMKVSGTPADAETRLEDCQKTVRAFRDEARKTLGIDTLSNETRRLLTLNESRSSTIVRR